MSADKAVRPHFSALSGANLPWFIAGAGLLLMYGPSFWDLFNGLWRTDSQSHGPVVLALSVWLMWRAWPRLLSAAPVQPRPVLAWALIATAALAYVGGRSQGILIPEMGSLVLMLAGLALLFSGSAGLRVLWFPLFFMIFMVPLPGLLVDAVTQPMKMAVSYCAEALLYAVGYPVSRTGVILQIGPYQLLVADACAGLHTLFTLEAMGLLYLNVVRSASMVRNVLLAMLVVPISFSANVIRVIALSLITYHFGDAAGQGFLHGFAGMVLFVSALLLIISADTALHGLLRLLGRRAHV